MSQPRRRMGEKEHKDNGEANRSGEEKANLVETPPKEDKLESNKERSESRKSRKKQRLLEEAAKDDLRGICYLNRIPPHMDPVKLRQILSQNGETQRIYLAPEGGRKRSSFCYHLWNIKYLSKFKWDDLAAEIAYKNAIQEQRQALEISAAKRERDFYLSKVDKSRALSSIEERLKKKQKVQEVSQTHSELPGSQQVQTMQHKANLDSQKKSWPR